MKQPLYAFLSTFRILGILSLLSLAACRSSSEQEGVRVDFIDPQIEPGNDFYRYANGTWAAQNPIPDNYARYGIYDQIVASEDYRLRKLIENCDVEADDPDQRRIATLFRLVRSDERRRQQGFQPIQKHLHHLDTLSDREALIRECQYQHSIDFNPLFELYRVDSLWILQASRLPLATSDYFATTEAARVSRQMYANNLQTLLVAYGYTPEQAQQIQVESFEFEARLSQIPHVSSKPIPLSEVEQLIHPFDIRSLMGTAVNDSTMVLCSDLYLRAVASMINEASAERLRAYVHSLFVRGTAPYLSPEIAQLANRTPLLAPNDHYALRDIEVIKHWLPHELSRLYRKHVVHQHTPERLQELWQRIQSAFVDKIQSQRWLTDSQKTEAIERIHSVRLWAFSKDDTPEDPQDLSDDSYWDAVEQLRRAYVRDGHKNENWLPAYATQVYYAYGEGVLMLPAGILQAPFFYPEGDKASNLGSMGLFMAGALADAAFQMSAQTTDVLAFARSVLGQRLSHLSAHVAFDPFHSLAMIKDLIALEVLDELRSQWVDPYQKKIDQLKPEQRFYMAYAQMNAEQMRQSDRLRALMDRQGTQAPAHVRVNMVLSNLHSWYQAFGVTPEHALYRKPEHRTVFFEN